MQAGRKGGKGGGKGAAAKAKAAAKPGTDQQTAEGTKPRESAGTKETAAWVYAVRNARELIDGGQVARAQAEVDKSLQQFVIGCGLQPEEFALDDAPYIRDAEAWLRDVFMPKYSSHPSILRSLGSIYAVRATCLREAGWFGRAALEFGIAAELCWAGDAAKGNDRPRFQFKGRRRLGAALYGLKGAEELKIGLEELKRKDEEDQHHLQNLMSAGPPPTAEELEDAEAACEEFYVAQLRSLCVGAVPGSATGIDAPARVALDRGGWRDKRLADQTRPSSFRRGTIKSSPLEWSGVSELPERVLDNPASPRLTDDPPDDPDTARRRIPFTAPEKRPLMSPVEAVIQCSGKTRQRRRSEWDFDTGASIVARFPDNLSKFEGERWIERRRRNKGHGGWCGETPAQSDAVPTFLGA